MALLMGVALCSAQPAAADPALDAGFKPHRAAYDIRLSAKKSSAKVANISGTMLYEWKPSCDAWVTNHKFDMMYEYVEVPTARVVSTFSTYESFDGKSFNYTSQKKQGDFVIQELRGNVERDDAAAESVAVYNMPAELTISLPAQTLFPVAHSLDVMKRIKAGERFFATTTFDGSDEDGPVEINTIVLKEDVYTPLAEPKEALDESLLKGKGWKIRAAFFPLAVNDEIADYEMSLVFHENGVMRDLEIDYGDFSVTQTLVALEEVSGGCDATAGEGNKKSEKSGVKE